MADSLRSENPLRRHRHRVARCPLSIRRVFGGSIGSGRDSKRLCIRLRWLYFWGMGEWSRGGEGMRADKQ